MRDYDGLLKAGTKAQMEKLIENDFKSGFDEMTIKKCIIGVTKEYAELIEEQLEAQGKTFYDDVEYLATLESIRYEAADIANYCHMLIFTMDKEIKRLNEIIDGINDGEENEKN